MSEANINFMLRWRGPLRRSLPVHPQLQFRGGASLDHTSGSSTSKGIILYRAYFALNRRFPRFRRVVAAVPPSPEQTGPHASLGSNTAGNRDPGVGRCAATARYGVRDGGAESRSEPR